MSAPTSRGWSEAEKLQLLLSIINAAGGFAGLGVKWADVAIPEGRTQKACQHTYEALRKQAANPGAKAGSEVKKLAKNSASASNGVSRKSAGANAAPTKTAVKPAVNTSHLGGSGRIEKPIAKAPKKENGGFVNNIKRERSLSGSTSSLSTALSSPVNGGPFADEPSSGGYHGDADGEETDVSPNEQLYGPVRSAKRAKKAMQSAEI